MKINGTRINTDATDDRGLFVTLYIMKKLIILSLVFLVFFSCKKEGPSTHIDPPPPDTTSFVIPKTEDIVMYEVNLRALSATGDFQGVTGRLDEIKALGINVIWLMPINPVGVVNSVNSPYCVRNYKEVNPEFGTMNDFKELVKKAHDLDMAIIIDWVANHTSWDNPWISNKDWYTQDGNGNIISPPGTNWLDVADLNYSSQEMRLNMIEAMKYWVTTTDIDGFRCDAADFVPFDFWKQAITALDSTGEKDLILLAEGSRADHFTAGFQMNYSWNFYDKIIQVFRQNAAASSLFTIHNAEYSGLPAGKQKLRFTTNHDKSAWDGTPMVLFNGEQGALAASVITIYLGGIPLIYGSQEVGVEENIPFFSNAPINWSLHPEMLQAYKDIINFRNGSDALKKGALVSYPNTNIMAFRRTFEQKEVLVLVNVRNSVISYIIPAELVNTVWKNAFDSSDVTLPAGIDLGAFEYLVLTK
jgi:glycosidase